VCRKSPLAAADFGEMAEIAVVGIAGVDNGGVNRRGIEED